MRTHCCLNRPRQSSKGNVARGPWEQGMKVLLCCEQVSLIKVFLNGVASQQEAGGAQARDPPRPSQAALIPTMLPGPSPLDSPGGLLPCPLTHLPPQTHARPRTNASSRDLGQATPSHSRPGHDT